MFKHFPKKYSGFPSLIWLLGHQFGGYKHRSMSSGSSLVLVTPLHDRWWQSGVQWLHFATCAGGRDSTLVTSVGNSMVKDATLATDVSGLVARDAALQLVLKVR